MGVARSHPCVCQRKWWSPETLPKQWTWTWEKGSQKKKIFWRQL